MILLLTCKVNNLFVHKKIFWQKTSVLCTKIIKMCIFTDSNPHSPAHQFRFSSNTHYYILRQKVRTKIKITVPRHNYLNQIRLYVRFFVSLHKIATEVEQPLHIDIREAVEKKAPRYAKLIPGFIYRLLERTVRQDELNRILKENADKKGVDFAAGVLKSLDVKVEAKGLDSIPTGGRYIFVSNHPLGGLDGMALISLLGSRFGKDNIKCIVNDILMLIKPLENVFLPINKHGRQSRKAMEDIDSAYSGNMQLITFPAGLCSRRDKNGLIRDMEWKKSFVTKSIETQRDVVPVYFGGKNSSFFYKFARFRKKTGIKLNVEMVLLPGEMVDGKGSTFHVKIGKPISYTTFDNSRTQKEWAEEIKKRVYLMSGE